MKRVKTLVYMIVNTKNKNKTMWIRMVSVICNIIGYILLHIIEDVRFIMVSW